MSRTSEGGIKKKIWNVECAWNSGETGREGEIDVVKELFHFQSKDMGIRELRTTSLFLSLL